MTDYTHLNNISVQGSVVTEAQGKLIGAFSELPAATVLNRGFLVLYTGETTSKYIHGKYYESDGSAWNLSTTSMMVDTALSDSSVNPVQNSTVTGALNAIDARVLDLENRTDMVYTTFPSSSPTASELTNLWTAAAGKAPFAGAYITDISKALTYGFDGSTWVRSSNIISKDQIGLGNVDNTSDADKPVSTAQKAYADGLDARCIHDTGNEEIAGRKTFTDTPYVSRVTPTFVINNTHDNKTDPSNNSNVENGIYISGSDNINFGKFISLLDSQNTVRTRMVAWSGNVATIELVKMADNTAYATAPSTADSHPDTAIVTKKYLLDKIAFSKQPYVVAYDPAVAITNPKTCITYQGRCASYTKPVMSNNVLDRGSWDDEEPLLKRIQYCTFRADGTIKEVLYKNDLNKVWIKNYEDGTPDVPLYANGELMEYCATLSQPSEIPSDATESSITTLDTMVVIPTLYTYGDERGFRISLDPSQGEAEAHTIDGEVCKYIAIGVYLGTVKDDKLMSVSHAEPTRSTSRYNFRAKLIGKDESHGKWRLLNYWDSRLIKMLSVLVGGSLNSQAVFGNGMTASMGIDASGLTDTWTRNYATYTGKTNTTGMFGQSDSFTQKYDADNFGKYDNGNTTAVRQVKCLIEAPWGQCWQFADDHCNEPSTGRIFAGKNSAGVIHPLDNNDGLYFTNQVANPTLIDHICTIVDPTDGLPGLLTEARGAYFNVIHTESAAWGLPAVKAGSSSTGSCDGWWMLSRSSAGVKNGIVGGSSRHCSACGSFYWDGYDTLSWTGVSFGARPVFVFN